MRFLFSIAIILVVLLATAEAAVLHVPADSPGVEAALYLVEPYDTVMVSPGSYAENIIWPDKSGIKLLSEAGAEQTLLDGGARDQVIGIYSGVDSSTVIRGFTITNGISGGS